VLAHANLAGKLSASACKHLQTLLDTDGTSALDLSYALRAAQAMSCLKGVSASVVSKVQSALESGNVADVYAAAAALPVLAAHKQDLTVSWPFIVDDIAGLAEVSHPPSARE
jgi:hypothetical protein